MRTIRITHRFNLARPTSALLLLAALFAGMVGHVLGPWGVLTALGVLIATRAVTIGIGEVQPAVERVTEEV